MKWKVTFKTLAFTDTLLESTSFMFFKGPHQKLPYTHTQNLNTITGYACCNCHIKATVLNWCHLQVTGKNPLRYTLLNSTATAHMKLHS